MHREKIDDIVNKIYAGNIAGVDAEVVDLLMNILGNNKDIDQNLFLDIVREINLAIESKNYVLVVDILHFILRDVVKE